MLDRADIDAIVDALAERLAPAPADGLVDVDVVCRYLGMKETWVYANQAKLGAHKLSDGAVRFDMADVRRYREACRVRPGGQVDELEQRRRNGTRHRGTTRTNVELLPLPEGAV